MVNNGYKLFKSLIVAITVAGALPFIAYPVAIKFFGFDQVLLLAPLLSYNLMVVAFMSGALWSSVKLSNTMSEKLKILFIGISVVLALIGWFSFYTASAYSQLIIYIGIFTVLLFLDFILYRHQTLPKWYFELRCLITLVVFISLVCSLQFV